MKKGESVRVYQDPITRKVMEGAATIVTIDPWDYDADTNLHLCRVRFRGENMTVIRRVRTCDIY